MRIISTQVASLASNSKLLDQKFKESALENDFEDAKFFESTGARALYFLSGKGSQLQFVGVHEQQQKNAMRLIFDQDPTMQIYGITSFGAQLLSKDRAIEFVSHRTHGLSGDSIIERNGPCIAHSMTITGTHLSTFVTMEPGTGFHGTLTQLSAIRMIALIEAQASFGEHTTIGTLCIGERDYTIAKTYRGSLKKIGENRKQIGILQSLEITEKSNLFVA